MIAKSLVELLASEGLERKRLEGKALELAEGIDRTIYELVRPPQGEKYEMRRLLIYAVAAYLALC
ncbi:hypothetical protein D6817_05310 [Candidatus Pacearchaeota archaeon]|nr:MAG: hypothetical protein D6817_05310 [Candidatus Pacearchaeota archaeon]